MLLMKNTNKRGRYLRKLGEVAYEHFHGCETCLSTQADEYLSTLLSRLKMSAAELRRSERGLQCPCCGTQLDAFSKVATYSDEDKRHHQRLRRWDRKYSPMYDDFRKRLIAYPTLGGLHPMARILARAIKQARAATLHVPMAWYRARAHADGGEIYRERDFLWPDPRKIDVPSGRFHKEGQCSYYLGDCPETTINEKLRKTWTRYNDDREEKIWIAQVDIIEPLRVLDLRMPPPFGELDPANGFSFLLYGSIYRGTLREPIDATDKTKPQHRITQFIADLTRSRGLDGIVYTSSIERPFGYLEHGYCLVLLDPKPNMVRVSSFGLQRCFVTPEDDAWSLGDCFELALEPIADGQAAPVSFSCGPSFSRDILLR
jgi:hypothetical protein